MEKNKKYGVIVVLFFKGCHIFLKLTNSRVLFVHKLLLLKRLLLIFIEIPQNSQGVTEIGKCFFRVTFQLFLAIFI